VAGLEQLHGLLHGRPEAGVVGVEREGRVAAQHQRLVERGLEGLDDAGVALAHFDDATGVHHGGSFR